jgi:hypothetical protein
MEKEDKKQHESYGMIDICRFTGNGSQYFGSDLIHNGGVSISISNAEKVTKLSSDWYHSREELIRVEMSHNQFVDAITSGMNTSGVPCTIKRYANNRVEQKNHVEDKKEQFSNDMKDTHVEYKKRIDGILELLEGNIGKRKASEIKHELEVLKSHISSNTNFVMGCFNEAMEKSVTEAKHSISNYIDHKVHSLGIEGMKKELQISIENE